LDGKSLLALAFKQNFQKSLSPPRDVESVAEVRKRLLRGAVPPFLERELIGELYDELAIAFSLAKGHDQDARQIVVHVPFFSGEIPNQMIARSIMLAEDIKVEGVYVVMESLVIKEELRYQAKILAVGLLVLSINLKN